MDSTGTLHARQCLAAIGAFPLRCIWRLSFSLRSSVFLVLRGVPSLKRPVVLLRPQSLVPRCPILKWVGQPYARSPRVNRQCLIRLLHAGYDPRLFVVQSQNST